MAGDTAPVDLADVDTLASVEAAARAVLPPDAWALVTDEAGSAGTLQRNLQALAHLAIEQRMPMTTKPVDVGTSFLGLSLPTPIIVAPMAGLDRFHPDGDLEMTRGATRDGGLAAISSTSGPPLEELRAVAGGPLVYRLEWVGDRAGLAEKLAQVAAAGVAAVVVQGTRARLTWADVNWLRTQVALPLGIKGSLSAQDVRIGLEHGLDFIWASNHGGRALDHARATLDLLPEIVDAVRGHVPIVVDSGFRCGADALKALAWGATLVAYGRQPLLGLARGGADGVHYVVRLLNTQLLTSLQLAGQTDLRRLRPDLIRRVDPSGFAVETAPARQPERSADPEADLMAQLPPAQREVVRALTENTELSEIDKMWGITEALFGEHVPGGPTLPEGQ